jgi:hypothetical protein
MKIWEYIFKEESLKHKFIEKYMLPLFDPAIEFFSQYGITDGTVICTTALIIEVIYEISIFKFRKDKEKFNFRLTLAIIITLIVAIGQSQFGWLR